MPLFGIETAIVVLTVGLAFAAPGLADSWFRAIEKSLGGLARRRHLSVAVVGLSALSLRLLLLPVLPIPEPSMHDEFSHLLAADTFASGRLTNPTHPMWIFFETIHVTQRPTYMSMYFPAKGMLLAAGKVIGGHPWFGVWASAGLMCAAICWMLQSWLPPGWALLGGMLAVIRLATFSYWMNSYWGGALPALGGALVLGALPRIIRSPRVHLALLMGFGLALLANTRPYEGLVLSIPVAVRLLLWMKGKKRPAPAALLWRLVVPTSLFLACVAVAMGYYNWRVFGNPLTLPYEVDRSTYAVAKHFVWQAPAPTPVYNHKVIRDFYTSSEMRAYEEARTLRGFVIRTVKKIGTVLLFFFGPALALPLIMLPRVLRDRRVRFLVIASAVMGLGLAVEVWLLPHYVAPATALIYALLLQGMRHLRQSRPEGRFLVRAMPVICLVMLAMPRFAKPPHFPTGEWLPSWYYVPPVQPRRSPLEARLQAEDGLQLVIVRYAPDHNPYEEWVYNEADIDHAKVVWAREMDPARTRKLIDYFKGRKVWLAEPDYSPPRLVPYPEASASGRE